MKVLVCGSRHFTDDDLFYEVLNRINDTFNHPDTKISLIISGGAKGADTLAEQFAHTMSIPFKKFPADWDKHGKAAGPIRNIQMLKEGKPDLVVAFLAPNSRGTKHMIKIAQEAGLQVEVINV